MAKTKKPTKRRRRPVRLKRIVSCNCFYWLRSFLFGFVRPEFWIMNNHFSDEWDKTLRRLLDTHDFSEITQYRASLGNYNMWVENYPYASFVWSGVRPRRYTIYRAMKKLVLDKIRAANRDS